MTEIHLGDLDDNSIEKVAQAVKSHVAQDDFGARLEGNCVREVILRQDE